ncbi:MAG: sigma 54-interacting transcriptional regulator [Deltaproteobacteria bacterium]|nr:sigma 54-interacting transcriptional regulator [Deltaproteobacteria bacterium]
MLRTSPDPAKDADVDTFDAKHTEVAGGQDEDLGVTIVAHPDAGMIGAFGLLQLSQGPVELSRLAPSFIRIDGARPVPLSDPHISRRPLTLSLDDGALVITQANPPVAAWVQGQSLVDQRRFTAAEVHRGIVVRVSRQIAVFIHNHGFVPWSHGEFGLAGLSGSMHDLRQQIRKVAQHEVPVLIQGESGVGKELVAHALHQASPRSTGPYVPVNVAAIPASTAASELFGHVRGAFTGAATEHDGFFARANGGTLLLDEIGELSHDVQAMLLRALETGEIQRVGDRRARKVSVRVVAATDRDIDSPQLAERLRAPLRHRLGGYTLRVPPLRHRKEDIPVLAMAFLQAEQRHYAETMGTHLPCAAIERMLLYNWPGNVRELRNVVRRLAIDGLGRSDAEIHESLDHVLRGPAADATQPEVSVTGNGPLQAPAAQPLRPKAIDDAMLLAALQRHSWQISPTARYLGIARSSLYGLIDQCPAIRRAIAVPDDELQAALAQTNGDVDRAAEALQVSPRGLRLRVRGS